MLRGSEPWKRIFEFKKCAPGIFNICHTPIAQVFARRLTRGLSAPDVPFGCACVPQDCAYSIDDQTATVDEPACFRNATCVLFSGSRWPVG
jgi:hypothetical protein